MNVIDRVLKRIGFVKLSRYGLVLTAEGRIMSLRPAVLDDGLGNRIVGWPDGDLAAMELEKLNLGPAPVKAVATPLASRAPMSPPVFTMPAPPPVVPVAVVAPPPPAPPVIATAAEPEEDDWEWTIAVARARAAAEEAEEAASSRFRDTVPDVRPIPALAVVSPVSATAQTVVAPKVIPFPIQKLPLTAQSPQLAPVVRSRVAVGTTPPARRSARSAQR